MPSRRSETPQVFRGQPTYHLPMTESVHSTAVDMGVLVVKRHPDVR
jgi:hypothetical protein